MIEIVFHNGNMCHYNPEAYTDYKYDGKYFIVIREKQWIGFYNLDYVEYIEVRDCVLLQRESSARAYETLEVPASEVEKYLKDGWKVM